MGADVNLEVTFLGTGASWPTRQRGMSAIAVKRGGEVLLLDCGEGTQRQMQGSDVSYQQITQIYLTHFHGDHCYGLPGLLKTMALNERTTPLEVYGPKGLYRVVDGFRRIGGWPKQFPIHVQELAPGDTVEKDGYRVEAHDADHSVRNLAFALQEDDRPGRFDKPKALEMGIPEGPLFGRLQRGQTVDLDDGRTISPDEVLGPSRPGRRVVYSGDSQPCDALTAAARDADLFICESTFTVAEKERAREVKHMCAGEAAAIAHAAGARALALTHISPRYKDPAPVLEEAQAVYPDARLVADLDTLDVPYRDS